VPDTGSTGAEGVDSSCRNGRRARPLVSVQPFDPAAEASTAAQAPLPAVFVAPIRDDIVQAVHRDMNKNERQALLRF